MSGYPLPTHAGTFGGLAVIENPRWPSGTIVHLPEQRTIMCRDASTDVRLPLALAEMRQQIRTHLDVLVAEAEMRLGIGPPPQVKSHGTGRYGFTDDNTRKAER